jgi:hypothetical protein
MPEPENLQLSGGLPLMASILGTGRDTLMAKAKMRKLSQLAKGK